MAQEVGDEECSRSTREVAITGLPLQFYSFTVLQFYSFTVLQFYSFTVLPFRITGLPERRVEDEHNVEGT
jgi:hypothetical protein